MTFHFGSTGMLAISMLDTEAFALPGSSEVWANIEFLQEDQSPASPVPEPASAFLLGSGLLAGSLLMRRKKH